MLGDMTARENPSVYKRLTILHSAKNSGPILATLLHHALTLYSIITPLKFNIFENIMENGAFVNAPFFIFLKVFETLHKFFLIFFSNVV